MNVRDNDNDSGETIIFPPLLLHLPSPLSSPLSHSHLISPASSNSSLPVIISLVYPRSWAHFSPPLTKASDRGAALQRAASSKAVLVNATWTRGLTHLCCLSDIVTGATTGTTVTTATGKASQGKRRKVSPVRKGKGRQAKLRKGQGSQDHESQGGQKKRGRGCGDFGCQQPQSNREDA